MQNLRSMDTECYLYGNGWIPFPFVLEAKADIVPFSTSSQPGIAVHIEAKH